MGWFTGGGGGGLASGLAGAPGAYEEVTVSDAAVALTEATYKPSSGRYAGREAVAAEIRVSGADIRYRIDAGSDSLPTTDYGIPALDTEIIGLPGTQAIRQFRAIRDDSTDAVLHVTYFF